MQGAARCSVLVPDMLFSQQRFLAASSPSPSTQSAFHSHSDCWQPSVLSLTLSPRPAPPWPGLSTAIYGLGLGGCDGNRRWDCGRGPWQSPPAWRPKENCARLRHAPGWPTGSRGPQLPARPHSGLGDRGSGGACGAHPAVRLQRRPGLAHRAHRLAGGHGGLHRVRAVAQGAAGARARRSAGGISCACCARASAACTRLHTPPCRARTRPPTSLLACSSPRAPSHSCWPWRRGGTPATALPCSCW